MANKKRRKPSNRPRTQPGAVRTAERDDEVEARPAPQDRPARERRNGSTTAAARNGGRAEKGRAEKKEMARRQREEVRRRIRRAQRVRLGAWVVGSVVVVGAAFLWLTRSDGPPAATEDLPGLLRTEAPWPVNSDEAPERADLINLPPHQGTLALHQHANVQLFVHGTPHQVPQNVGIDGADAASIHTHTSDGLVHVESTQVAEFTLGQFFDVWGVRYTDRCLGAYCNDTTSQIRVFVDGEPYTGADIRGIPIDDEHVFVVTYGTEDELPDPIPASFDFDSIQA